MEPSNTYNKNRPAIKSASAVFCVTVSLFLATVPAEANNNSSFENYLTDSRVTQYVSAIDITTLQGNVSVIKQNGDNNQASVVQSRSASYQLGNFAYIYQRGNSNQGNISQSNGKNVGIIVQVGNDNAANIVQEGHEFRAEINQFGFGSDITLSQSGSGLQRISIEQQNHSGSALPVTIDTY